MPSKQWLQPTCKSKECQKKIQKSAVCILGFFQCVLKCGINAHWSQKNIITQQIILSEHQIYGYILLLSTKAWPVFSETNHHFDTP